MEWSFVVSNDAPQEPHSAVVSGRRAATNVAVTVECVGRERPSVARGRNRSRSAVGRPFGRPLGRRNPAVLGVSVREHGDARRAIDLFRPAGEIARDDDSDHVSEEHVRAANDDAEVTWIQDLIRGCPTQAKIAIAALAAMDEFTDQSHVKATETYRVYREFANALDTNVLGQKRITDQLREYETLKTIDMTRTSGGCREGTYLQLSLLDGSDRLLQSIGLDDRCSRIPIDSGMRKTDCGCRRSITVQTGRAGGVTRHCSRSSVSDTNDSLITSLPPLLIGVPKNDPVQLAPLVDDLIDENVSRRWGRTSLSRQ